MALSTKSLRLLEKLGVTSALARGESPVCAGPVYESRRQPGCYLRLAFDRDDENRVQVGYARFADPDWEIVELEPFSQRALGYYERRLKRLGNYAGHTVPKAGASGGEP